MARLTKRLIVLAVCLMWGIASMLVFVYAPASTDPNGLLLRVAEISCNCTFKISSMTQLMTGSGNAALTCFFIYQIAVYLLLGWGFAVAIFPTQKIKQTTESNTDTVTEFHPKDE